MKKKPIDYFMEEGEAEEKIRETLKKISKLPLKDILSYAIKGERDATRLYAFLYKKIDEPYLKNKFKQFLETEKSHDEKVSQIFKELFPNERPTEIHIETWIKPFEECNCKLDTVRDYLNVLETAMDSERLAKEVYTFLEKQMRDPVHKRIFLELAEDELEHYKFVKSEYEFYKKIKAEQDFQELLKELLKNRETRDQ
jgi:rubrerythrin